MKLYPVAFIGLLLFATTTPALEIADGKQSDSAHPRIQQATPYALDQTLQTFTKTVHGGVQHVVVKAADNVQQIKLIQAHLSKIADEFRKGDFSTTERMHGSGMPGLTQLKTAKTDEIKFEYKALENGAQIHYATEYPQFVQALHEWFDAQASDHGNDEIPGHSQHHSTPAQ